MIYLHKRGHLLKGVLVSILMKKDFIQQMGLQLNKQRSIVPLQYLMKLKVLTIFILIILASATEKSRIRKLTESNLEAFSKDNSYWLIQISEGRCASCIQQEAELEQLAFMLDGVVKVGKIDKKLIPTLKIDKIPTYMFTRSDQPQKSKPYEGKFNKKDLAVFCLEQISTFVKAREGKKPTPPNDKQSEQSGKSRSESSSQSAGSSSTVIELNDKNFEEKVLKSNDAWLVEFYSPGCGHCRNFEPEYSKLPRLIGKRVHISRIDGSKNQQFMGKYQVKGFPTVLLFDTQDKSQPIPYQGQRTAQAVTEWLKTQNINQEKKQILELTQSNYAQECNKNIVCLIFVLDRKSDRSKLSFLKDMIVEQAQRPVRFFYSERLRQFENDLMINDREAPFLVSVWDSINSYKIYNGEISHQGVTEYLKTILERRGWIKYQNKIGNTLFAKNTDL